MKSYLITGPRSLLTAAQYEMAQAGFEWGTSQCRAAEAKSVYLHPEIKAYGTTWQSVGDNPLTLPADWDKLMGILAELNKPKLPEYVRANFLDFRGVAKVVKGVKSQLNDAVTAQYEMIDVYGHTKFGASANCTPITEAEFIEGGLKELAGAGFAKGVVIDSQRGRPHFAMQQLLYLNSLETSSHSPESRKEVGEKGFCFVAAGGNFRRPVSQCALMPNALPTTSNGIPYLIKGCQVFYGHGDNEGRLTVGNLRHLLKQGITGLDTKAGRLTKEDLELLTK